MVNSLRQAFHRPQDVKWTPEAGQVAGARLHHDVDLLQRSARSALLPTQTRQTVRVTSQLPARIHAREAKCGWSSKEKWNISGRKGLSLAERAAHGKR